MKRYLLFLMVVLLASLDINAQMFNVYVKYSDGAVASNVEIYSFVTEKLAKNSVANYKNSYKVEVGSPKKNTGHATTGADGFCMLEADRDGYIVVDDPLALSEPLVLRLSACLVDGEIRITIKKTIKIGEAVHDEKGEMVTMHREKTFTQILPPPPPPPPISVSYGRSKMIGGLFEIDSDFARDDARFVVFPRVVFPDLDSVLYLKPTVVDGALYRKDMHRRMGLVSDNDKLDFYRLDNSFNMKAHTDDMFEFIQYVDVDKGVRYYADAQVWYEDFNGIYNRYVKKLQDGKEAEPMRFLDWDAAKRTVKIDATQYKKEGKLVQANDSQNFRLEFEVGKESLNLSDSVTLAERDKLLDMFRGYNSNREIEVLGISVKGYSSPEGLYARNSVLSHGRANTIVNMLKREFPRFSREIRPEFDENNNVVTWEAVANTMENGTDPVALQYASIIKEVVAQKKGFDAQQAELKKNKQLWDYVKDSVLPSVRRVEISVELLVSKVLTLEEIVSGYQKGTLFQPGQKTMDYQYYELMRWLAANEKWDELMVISKMAYDDRGMIETGRNRQELYGAINPKDAELNTDTIDSYLNGRPGYCYLQIDTTEATGVYAETTDNPNAQVKISYRLNGRTIKSKSVQKPGSYLFEIYVDDVICLYQQKIELTDSKPMVLRLDLKSSLADYPYPLAAYYYATCLLQRGEVDTEIMKQYLDDGRLNKKINGKIHYNDKAMIVTQILMHCQDGDFEPANKLIVKYGLTDKDPELKPLIMFVRCLAGDFGKKEIQDYIKSTSPMNEAVILAALQKWTDALKILVKLPQDDARVQYLTAICKYRSQNNSMIQLDQPPYQSGLISTIGEPMLKAFELDKENVKYLENDGYFNDAYRLLVFYFWKRINEGVDREQIAKEYDALVSKNRENQ